MSPKQPGRLITLIRKEEPDRRCCVVLPGAGGGLGPYLGLAAFLGRTHDVYAVRAAGLMPGEQAEASVAAMADSAVRAIGTGAIRPDLVFGWSLGGAIGWELCLRLTEQGQFPDLVLVDSTPLPRGTDGWTDTEVREIVVGMLGPHPDARTVVRVETVLTGQIAALADYRPQCSYSGRTLLLMCSNDRLRQQETVLARWRELAPRLTEGRLAAEHFSVFDPGHLPELTGWISDFVNGSAALR